MGEWSKQIGDVGEEIVGKLLREIGWGDNQSRVEIACAEETKHARKGSERRQTHGIDFLFSYRSPFCDGMLDNLVISAKYSADAYPPSPKSQFRSHFEDLVQTVHCFGRSDVRRVQIEGMPGTRRSRDIGVSSG